MTSRLTLLSVMFFCAMSCAEQDWCGETPVSVEFGVDFTHLTTKASVFDDRTVSLRIFVFDSATGRLESEGHTDSGKLSLMVPSGKSLSCRAFLNLPELNLQQGEGEDELLRKLVRMEGFTDGLLPMCASERAVFKSSGTMSLLARRMVSKVVLDTLECPFIEKLNGVSEVRLVRMFLENVCGSEPVSMVPTDSGLWLNRMELDGNLPGDVRPYLVCELGSPVKSSAAMALYRSLYCLPNPVSADISSATDPLWSPRPTRLVLEFSVDGITQYYPVTFSRNMQSNCVYRIKRLRLSGPGSDNPDIPVAGRQVSLSVSVEPWEDSESQNVTM